MPVCRVRNVFGNVFGSVVGNVFGNVFGYVFGNVFGSVVGNVFRSVFRKVFRSDIFFILSQSTLSICTAPKAGLSIVNVLHEYIQLI